MAKRIANDLNPTTKTRATRATGPDLQATTTQAGATVLTLEPVYTAEEVATHLRMHLQTVRKLTREGHMPCRRQGRAIRYTAADINTYLKRIADSGLAA